PYLSDARVLTLAHDFSRADLERVVQDDRPFDDGFSVVCYLPEFFSPHIGGIATILRAASHLAATRQVNNRLILLGAGDAGSARLAVAEAFPALADAEIVCSSLDDLANHTLTADCCVASL